MNLLELATSTTVNLNTDNKSVSECIREIGTIGQSTYANICNGQVTTIPWGGGDWVVAASIGLLVLFCIVFVFWFIKQVILDR